MKKILLFSMMCLMALSMQAQNNNGEYVDLGLPSGTLWKSANEKGGFITWGEAMQRYGDKLPSLEQWEELKGMCKWTWTGKGYKVTGDNGNSIVLPAAGMRADSDILYVGTEGYYWSSTSAKLYYRNGESAEGAWYFWFDYTKMSSEKKTLVPSMSVRLVQ